MGLETLALGSASAPAGPIGFGPGFVQEDQAGRVEARLLADPPAAGSPDVRTVLFAGPESLFYMSGPSAAEGAGWLGGCSAPPGPGAVLPGSGRVCGPANPAVIAGGSGPGPVCGRNYGDGAAGRRCSGVAGEVF